MGSEEWGVGSGERLFFISAFSLSMKDILVLLSIVLFSHQLRETLLVFIIYSHSE